MRRMDEFAARLPWPDIRGRRCLHVGASDGSLAGALERRGAGAVERLDPSVETSGLDRFGRFEVVVAGGLVSRLRDPVRALTALRSACDGWLLSAEEIDVRLSLLHPRRPVARLGDPELGEWWRPNAAGHRAMLETAGFAVERGRGPYALRAAGVPHQALLARPEPV